MFGKICKIEMDYVTLQECIRQQSVHSIDKEDDNSITSSEQFLPLAQSNSFFEQWTLLQKTSGILA